MQLRGTEARRLSEPEKPLEPVLLPGWAGPLFALYHAPRGSAGAAAHLIYLPPFAEEMNRARRMAALEARALAAAGVGVLLLDPFGCGDSAGDFGDARWSIWRDDVGMAADWLAARGAGTLGLWGLRLGALLAADAARASPGRYRRLVLWQPVTSGAGFLTQFLRIRLAGGLGGKAAAETTAQLRQSLKNGVPLEIGGYVLTPDMAAAIDALRLEEIGRDARAEILWLEVTGRADAPLSPASEAVAAAWRQQGMRVETEVVAGEPFWATPEITLAPALIDVTTRRLR